MVLEVSNIAIDKIFDFITDHTTQKLRVKVVGGGCSGLRYDLAFDDKVDPNHDIVIDAHTFHSNIQIVIDEKSALYVQGSSLEYVDTLMESGFKILNPNAQNTCGCGESFGV